MGLRSPLAFVPLRGAMIPEPAAIRFERWEFVWHPPTTSSDGRSEYGPMVAANTTGDEMDDIAYALQRFLSAIAYAYDLPVEDDADAQFLAGTGGDDPFNPSGRRIPRPYTSFVMGPAPAELSVPSSDDERLLAALAYYREGLNASSPFYRALAFRHVLDATFNVTNETRNKQPTPEAVARDAFVDATAPSADALNHRFYGMAVPPGRTLSAYLTDEVRNAVAHVLRPNARQVHPDQWFERRRMALDTRVMRTLARMAVEQRWPQPVVTTSTP
jgi:Methylamine utilization protein MauJ